MAGEKFIGAPGLLRTHQDFLDYDEALRVINNWRASHSYPLNTFQTTLRRKGRSVDPEALVAQRIKRLSSIAAKLRRFPTMKLSQMQDIGGCRAIVTKIDQVAQLVDLYAKGDLKHKLVIVDDYIDKPKTSGYRGVHLVYRYFSDKNKTEYNGLKIEMQLRSYYQHAWATAVETVGTLTNQALKSSFGDEEWLRFFCLMGSVIAAIENRPLVPGTPTAWSALRDELQAYVENLQVLPRLKAVGDAIHHIEERIEDAHFFLMRLSPEKEEVEITGFRANQAELAADKYLEAERAVSDDPASDAVLVSVDAVANLRKAYPNYFLDTEFFREVVGLALR